MAASDVQGAWSSLLMGRGRDIPSGVQGTGLWPESLVAWPRPRPFSILPSAGPRSLGGSEPVTIPGGLPRSPSLHSSSSLSTSPLSSLSQSLSGPLVSSTMTPPQQPPTLKSEPGALGSSAASYSLGEWARVGRGCPGWGPAMFSDTRHSDGQDGDSASSAFNFPSGNVIFGSSLGFRRVSFKYRFAPCASGQLLALRRRLCS